MASSVYFNGKQYTTPTTASAVNDSAMAPANNTVGNVLALLGQAGGGQPMTALIFDNPTDAAATLLSGDLCTAAVKSFAASNDASGSVQAPSQIICIRTDEATQGTAVIADSASNPAITLASVQYGLTAGQVSYKVDNGSTSGLKLSVQLGSQLFSQDNVGRTAFTIEYTGAAATAQISVTNSTVNLFAPNGTSVAAISLANYSTVAQLVGAINSYAGFSATTVAGSETTSALNGLDNIAATTVPKTGTPLNVNANLQAAVEWFNGAGQNLVTATRTGTLPPAPVNWTYLTGATEMPAQTADWADALTLLQTLDVQWVVALTALTAVWAAVDAHVQYMSSVGAKERRAFVGPAAGTTEAEYLAFRGLLNSDRTSIVGPGYYDFNAAGVLVLLDPFQTAAMVAAGFAGAPPGTPMTNKSFTARGLEINFKNPADTDLLIQAGILALQNTSTGYKVVRSISSWITNNNYNRVEVSCGAAVDYVTRTVRAATDVVRGMGATPQALARALGIAKVQLNFLAVPAPTGPGVIVGDANSPAWQNLTGSIEGDEIVLNWECSPVIPLNFVFNSLSIVPYSGTASA